MKISYVSQSFIFGTFLISTFTLLLFIIVVYTNYSSPWSFDSESYPRMAEHVK